MPEWLQPMLIGFAIPIAIPVLRWVFVGDALDRIAKLERHIEALEKLTPTAQSYTPELDHGAYREWAQPWNRAAK